MFITDNAREYLLKMIEEKGMDALCLYLDPTGNLSLALVEKHEVEKIEEVNGVKTAYFGMTDLLKDNMTIDYKETGLTVEIPPEILGENSGCGGCGGCGGCSGCGDGDCGGCGME